MVDVVLFLVVLWLPLIGGYAIYVNHTRQENAWRTAPNEERVTD
jgi:uncharacterized membrane protein YqhA